MRFFILADLLIIIPVIGLSGLSLFLLGSNSPDLLFSQTSFFLLGLIFFFIMAKIDFFLWFKLIWLVYLLSFIFLLLSFFAPEVRGAHRWIFLGNFGLQPSEFIKPFMIMTVGFLLSKEKGKGLINFLRPFFIISPFILMIFRQPDLGNVLVYLGIFLSLALLSGMPWRYLIGGAVLAIVILPFFWSILADYQKLRIISFLNPQADPRGAGYNALQSVIAIGSGQLFGLGLGKGSQSRLLFLPEYHTDFVFASIGEALGLFGGILLIFFYSLLLIRGLMVSQRADNEWGRLTAIGIFAQIFIQVFINIGMNLGILPITGITLPLVSYGGSSILSTFMGLGLLKSIEKRNKPNPLVVG